MTIPANPHIEVWHDETSDSENPEIFARDSFGAMESL
jgi:hypothetical protein